MPPSSVVIKEIIESPADSKSSNSEKGQAPLAIEGFTPLVLTLPTVVGPASSSVQEGIAIVPVIWGFDPLILPKPALGISGVSGSKALEAILLSPVVINPKMFSIAPNCKLRMVLSFACRSRSFMRITIMSLRNTMCPWSPLEPKKRRFAPISLQVYLGLLGVVVAILLRS